MYSIEFTYEEMIDSIKNISNQLSQSMFDPEIIISVNRGGCIPGIYLSHFIDKPHEAISIQFRNSDKGPNTKSIEKKIKNYKSVLIIDDINDSGRTISFIKELCKKIHTEVHYAVLVNNLKSSVDVEYSGKSIDSKPDDSWYIFPWENWWKLNEK